MESNNAPDATAADRALALAASFSRYAARALAHEPHLLRAADVAAPLPARALHEAVRGEPAADEAALRRSLRRLRKRVLLRLIARDLGGLADLGEVVATVTALAEAALQQALAWLERDLARVHGLPRGGASGAPQQLHVVGMGKLGGAELNVSSDIDLVFLYPEEGETDGARPLSNHEFFSRLGRRLIGVISEITEDGLVFRTDMRLRPYGDSGPLVASFDMLENYFITQGREWERYAWIKGRPLTGDRGAELMELVRPFVYRRHLDYSAFASMRELHRQIRREVERRDLFDDIKLGPGGIREIEFIAQVFQLIRGGRDAALRAHPTLEVLALLAERGLLPAQAAAGLREAYVFLRNLEHRLQYLDDAQTQTLPAEAGDRERVARAMGCAGWQAFSEALARHRACVTRHFEEIFASSPPPDGRSEALSAVWQPEPDSARAEQALAGRGFGRAAELCRQLAALRGGSRYRQMPASSQARLDRLVPLAIEAAAGHAAADARLERMLRLLESVSRRESYLALLEEYPQALARLAELMGASPWVADYLTQHPILLDELLDSRTLYAPPDWPALSAALRAALDDAAGDTEKQMDTLRHFKHAQTLRLVAQDLAGTLPLETLSDHLSDLACAILGEVLRLAWDGLRQRHRDDPRFAIVGYGKLGGKELGYASDLDLVFIYDDEAAEAAENYARLAQRINNWLTRLTPAGVLYDTDLRLRPDGASGLLVSPLASFSEYQLRQAWIWEHQALTRARFVAGDAAIGARFEALRVQVLRQPRDLAALRREVVAMRARMLDAHPNRSGLFDIKHDRGGIIDVEFMVQYLVLGHAAIYPALTGNIGNLALLALAAELGLIEAEAAAAVREAYRGFRRLQHALRLQGERYARVERERIAASADAVLALWRRMFAETEG